jgi:hypothetical protein
MMRFSG